jgi:hypothetical protein
MSNALPDCILPPADSLPWAPPLDTRDLAVRLEADGITDSVARSQYGFDDVWHMANEYLRMAQTQPTIEPPGKRLRSIRDYFKGMSFAVPLVTSCLLVLVAKVSLWGGSLTGNEAALIAIATIASFVITGGFVQIIGRQGYFYKESKEWSLFSRSCWSFVRAGSLALGYCVIVGIIANAYFRWVPLALLGWCTVFHLGIGAFLLMGGVLYVLDGELFLAAGTLIGTGVVLILHSWLHIPLLVSQTVGIVATVAVCVAFAQLRFRSLAGRSFEPVSLPSWGQLAYSLWPYFVYGVLYYLFLFADRILAWSAHTEGEIIPLQFRSGYETALDICLFAFILQVGWIHAGIVRFHHLIATAQKRYTLAGRTKLKPAVQTFYKRQLLIFLLLFIVSTIAVILTVEKVHGLRATLLFRVFLLVLAGIPLLTVGLWNTALLFALSRPAFVLNAISGAVVLNVSSGYVLSRLFTYDLAIVGFDIGALALAVISSWFCVRLLADFDYHYFAAAV